MNLAEQIRNARKAQKKTLRQLAKETGISYQYISDIELGKKEPSWPKLQRLAKALQLNILLAPADKKQGIKKQGEI